MNKGQRQHSPKHERSHGYPYVLFPKPAARPTEWTLFFIRRALSEQSELARLPETSIHPILMGLGGASTALGPFAETKGARLSGRNPTSRGKALMALMEGVDVLHRILNFRGGVNEENSYSPTRT